jgi:hypothetical protein
MRVGCIDARWLHRCALRVAWFCFGLAAEVRKKLIGESNVSEMVREVGCTAAEAEWYPECL